MVRLTLMPVTIYEIGPRSPRAKVHAGDPNPVRAASAARI